MVGEIVVVFDRLESMRFAEETEVVDSNGIWEKVLERLDHTKSGAEDRCKSDRWSDGLCCVGVIERGLSLCR